MSLKFKRPPILELRKWRNWSSQRLFYEAFPHVLLESLSRYLRISVEGESYLPVAGRVLLTPNHSGFAGIDALLLAHELKRLTRRPSFVLTHPFWFWSKWTAQLAHGFGPVEATQANGISHLEKDQQVVIFPEAEHGNFKPSLKAYQLQQFHRGFVRMALKTGTPIIPTLIVGAEETFINLSQLKIAKILKVNTLPIPLNLFPLPARWTIRFLPPIHWPLKPDQARDEELIAALADEVRDQMQRSLTEMVSQRGSIFVGSK